MKFEFDHVRIQHEQRGLQWRNDVKDLRTEVPDGERNASQRAIRVQTDALINSLISAKLSDISLNLAYTMTVIASRGLQCGIQPSATDLVVAMRELIEDARIVVLRGLQHCEVEQVSAGVAMMELVVAGICAVLHLPYHELFMIVHEQVLKDPDIPPNLEAVNSLLRSFGHDIPPAPPALQVVVDNTKEL